MTERQSSKRAASSRGSKRGAGSRERSGRQAAGESASETPGGTRTGTKRSATSERIVGKSLSKTSGGSRTGTKRAATSGRKGARSVTAAGSAPGAADLRRSAKRISGAVSRFTSGRLVTPNEVGLGATPLPAEALAAASRMLDQLAKGKRPTLMVLDDNDELTTEQAAEVLGVSRPHVVHLLEAERIPHRRVGDSKRGHRRIKREDVLDLKRRREAALEGMDELMRLSEQLAD